MQFAEGLSDRHAADAVRVRIDCKYALSLELSNPGFDASVLYASSVSGCWSGSARWGS
jgi:transposase